MKPTPTVTAQHQIEALANAIANIVPAEQCQLDAIAMSRQAERYKEVILCFDAIMSPDYAATRLREIMDVLEFIRRNYNLIPESTSQGDPLLSARIGVIDNSWGNKMIIKFKLGDRQNDLRAE